MSAPSPEQVARDSTIVGFGHADRLMDSELPPSDLMAAPALPAKVFTGTPTHLTPDPNRRDTSVSSASSNGKSGKGPSPRKIVPADACPGMAHTSFSPRTGTAASLPSPGRRLRTTANRRSRISSPVRPVRTRSHVKLVFVASRSGSPTGNSSCHDRDEADSDCPQIRTPDHSVAATKHKPMTRGLSLSEPTAMAPPCQWLGTMSPSSIKLPASASSSAVSCPALFAPGPVCDSPDALPVAAERLGNSILTRNRSLPPISSGGSVAGSWSVQVSQGSNLNPTSALALSTNLNPHQVGGTSSCYGEANAPCIIRDVSPNAGMEAVEDVVAARGQLHTQAPSTADSPRACAATGFGNQSQQSCQCRQGPFSPSPGRSNAGVVGPSESTGVVAPANIHDESAGYIAVGVTERYATGSDDTENVRRINVSKQHILAETLAARASTNEEIADFITAIVRPEVSNWALLTLLLVAEILAGSAQILVLLASLSAAQIHGNVWENLNVC